MTWLQNLGSRSRTVLIAAAVLVVVGVVAIVVAVRSQQSAPQPQGQNYTPSDLSTASAQSPSGSPGASSPKSASTSSSGSAPKSGTFPLPTSSAKTTNLPGYKKIEGPILSAAKPVSISIPSINVTSNLLTLGLTANREIQVPPLERDSKAGWYKYSPEPGTLGPAVILGHIDSAAYGPGIFFRLGAMKKGDLVSVTRSDHTVAVFKVDGISEYKKIQFPTRTVYGNTNNAALRLITCGGTFDAATHNYESNIVVYASLVSSHKAG